MQPSNQAESEIKPSSSSFELTQSQQPDITTISCIIKHYEISCFACAPPFQESWLRA